MRMIPLLFALALALPAPAQFQVTPAKAYGAPEKKKKEHFFGGFLSATRQMPPLPYHPFPDLPLTEAGNNTFVYDDRGVDYPALAAVAAAEQAKTKTASGAAVEEGGGGMAMMRSGSGGPVLQIEFTGDDGRRISYDTYPGFIYTVEQSTNLVNWSVLETLVADDTNEAFYAFGEDTRFYRVLEGSDLIQFPDFFPAVHQSAYIDVYTPLAGTATVEIFRDGSLYYAVQGGIPAGGNFRVSDGLYNPANWPYDGYYNATNWQFRVTIVSPVNAFGQFVPAAEATGTTTNVGIVYKKGRIRPPIRTGITVYQRAALPANLLAAVETQFLEYMRDYFLANLQSSYQVDLSGALLNEFLDPVNVPAMYSAQDRDSLRRLLFGTLTNQVLSQVDRLHYFGHGTNTSFGGIKIIELKTNINCDNAFVYVALDGCRTAQTTDMLGEFTCYWKHRTLNDLREKGLTPGFGCGWKNTKNVAFFPSQGSLIDNHFDFWIDFYGRDGGLTHTPPQDPNGYFDTTYEQAYLFAKDPLGQGINPNRQLNPEANGFIRVGCQDCFWDL